MVTDDKYALLQNLFNSLDDKGKLQYIFNQTLTWKEDRKNWEDLKAGTDAFFLIIVAIIIVFMQCGFAFLEAGSVR